MHPGADRAGRDGVDQNALWAQLYCQRPGQGQDGALAHGIGGALGSGAQTMGGRDIDDSPAALGLLSPGCRLQGEVDTADIDLQHLVKLTGTHFEKPSPANDASRVDKGIQAARLGGNMVEGAGDAGGGGQVTGDKGAAFRPAFEQRGHLGFCFPPVEKENLLSCFQ